MILPQPRILPIAIAVTLVGIGFRALDVISLAVSGSMFTTVTSASAETAKPAADAAPASDAKSGDAKPGDGKTVVANAEIPGGGLPSHPPGAVSDDAKSSGELLQSLTEKRKQLDSREQEIVQREALLKAAEDRIDKKVDELSAMRTDLEKLLDIQKTKDDAQIASLVKIYENMKPKDAAAIFDNLELPVLVDVSAHMKEAKVAPILGSMSPERARVLTVRLAERRRNMEGVVADAKAALGDNGAPAGNAGGDKPADTPKP